LEIIQQPNRARMCGFGEKDRRPIDPPPILQLFVPEGTKGPADISSFVVHASIWCPTGEDAGLVSQPTTQAINNNNGGGSANDNLAFHRNLVGFTLSSAQRLKGLDGKPGIFFPFPDMSVRTEGTFKLRFVLINMKDSLNAAAESPVLADVISAPFQVYSAKKFPGMSNSTDISKHFAQQGVRINIRK
ncbi:hypothetical protein GQ42DRAFT_103583, partial [Ramicandelaber brevisporus]